MIGEKHVPIGNYGDFNFRDGAAYNGDKASSMFGASATNLPAKGPTDTRTGCFGSSHSGIVQFVLCDGAVRAISVGINGTVYANLANRMDGEVVVSLAYQDANIDNMEGLALRRGQNGETLLYMLSDNNYSGRQRTLLLMFELRER